jgi:hypothetical protein
VYEWLHFAYKQKKERKGDGESDGLPKENNNMIDYLFTRIKEKYSKAKKIIFSTNSRKLKLYSWLGFIYGNQIIIL